MEEHVKALLYAIGYLNITMPPDATVIQDGWDELYSSYFPSAQFSSPYAGQVLAWEKAGHKIHLQDTPIQSVLLRCPQQSLGADYEIAKALTALQNGGLLMIVADNKAGGASLSKRLAAFGCPVQDISKHKCRVVWTSAPEQGDKQKIKAAIEAGSIHKRLTDNLYTQAGVFSWEHQDSGTKILLDHLPQNISGKGADFGCGIGEISRFILNTFPLISSLACIDHDARAIECCKRNLIDFKEKTSFYCQDISQQIQMSGLDFIVMNPPFHNGKTEDKALGTFFITKAAAALRRGGSLYMVANSHLPYEGVSSSLFSKVTLVTRQNGFKVFEMVR